MTFPAWFAFHRDPALRRHTVALAIYSEMLIRPGSLSIPVEIKGWAWAKLLGARAEPAGRAGLPARAPAGLSTRAAAVHGGADVG